MPTVSRAGAHLGSVDHLARSFLRALSELPMGTTERASSAPRGPQTAVLEVLPLREPLATLAPLRGGFFGGIDQFGFV